MEIDFLSIDSFSVTQMSATRTTFQFDAFNLNATKWNPYNCSVVKTRLNQYTLQRSTKAVYLNILHVR